MPKNEVEIELALKHAQWLLENQIHSVKDLQTIWRIYGSWVY